MKPKKALVLLVCETATKKFYHSFKQENLETITIDSFHEPTWRKLIGKDWKKQAFDVAKKASGFFTVDGEKIQIKSEDVDHLISLIEHKGRMKPFTLKQINKILSGEKPQPDEIIDDLTIPEHPFWEARVATLALHVYPCYHDPEEFTRLVWTVNDILSFMIGQRLWDDQRFDEQFASAITDLYEDSPNVIESLVVLLIPEFLNYYEVQKGSWTNKYEGMYNELAFLLELLDGVIFKFVLLDRWYKEFKELNKTLFPMNNIEDPLSEALSDDFRSMFDLFGSDELPPLF